jgi:hypothetical protein
MNKVYYFLIIVIFSSCNKTSVEENHAGTTSNNDSSIDLSGELFYLGDTTSLKVDSGMTIDKSLFEKEIHGEGLFNLLNPTSIFFAKNNLLKINYNLTQNRTVPLTGKYGSQYNGSVGNITENFSAVLKYSIEGDTLSLPAVSFNYNTSTSSKYKIELQGDTIVHLKLILSSDELILRREKLSRRLYVYNESIPKEYTFDQILDVLTNYRCNHTFLVLKYD